MFWVAYEKSSVNAADDVVTQRETLSGSRRSRSWCRVLRRDVTWQVPGVIMGTILSFASPRLSYSSRKRSDRSVDDLSFDHLSYDLRFRHGSTASIGSHHGATGTGSSRMRGSHHQSIGETPQSGRRQRWHDPAPGKHSSRYPASPEDWAARPPPPPPPPPHLGDFGRGRRPTGGRVTVEQSGRHHRQHQHELDVRHLKDIENNNNTVWRRSELDCSGRTSSMFPKSTSCHTLATFDRVQLKNIANNNNNATTKNRHHNHYRFSCRIGDLAPPPPPPPPPPLAARLAPVARTEQLPPARGRTSTVVGRLPPVSGSATTVPAPTHAGKTTVIQASTSELLRLAQDSWFIYGITVIVNWYNNRYHLSLFSNLMACLI